MFRTVMGAGSLLLRGLGPSGLLVSRGLGGPVNIVVTIERPRQLRMGGGSGYREQQREIEQVRCIFISAKLVSVNDRQLTNPIEGDVEVCYGQDRFRVTSTLMSITKRTTNIRARYVGRFRQG